MEKDRQYIIISVLFAKSAFLGMLSILFFATATTMVLLEVKGDIILFIIGIILSILFISYVILDLRKDKIEKNGGTRKWK